MVHHLCRSALGIARSFSELLIPKKIDYTIIILQGYKVYNEIYNRLIKNRKNRFGYIPARIISFFTFGSVTQFEYL